MTSSLTTIKQIKEAAQMLDTAVVQCINANPPANYQGKLSESRVSLQRGIELADAPLRIAIVGEFNSGKTLLLNSLMDATDLFPALLQPTTGNVLEARVMLKKEERAPEIKKATIAFFNQTEIENILDYYLKDLRNNHGFEDVPSKIAVNDADLEKFEKWICKKFQETQAVTPKYALLATLEYILALRFNQQLVMREERISCALPIDLIAPALTLSGRPDFNKGIQEIYNKYKQLYSSTDGAVVEKITSKNLRVVFPLVRRVMVDIMAWCVPFGISNPAACNTLAFLDFPGLGAESSSARDFYLCMSEIRDAHAVLLLFNGSNPGGGGVSAMASLFQKVGKLTAERTMVAVNRFDEFHPLPAGHTVDSYYSRTEEGTTVGFVTLLMPAKNLLSSVNKKFGLYICSAMCYLFEEKARRPNWNFGAPQWFNDNKRQAAYTLYKRTSEDFQTLISEVEEGRGMLRDHQIMKEGLEKYLDRGGVPVLRSDIVHFAQEHGERLIREDSLKEVRNAVRILDEIAPAKSASEKGTVSPEVTYGAQEFYRILELAVADTLPSGPSEYKKLKMRMGDVDVSLWDWIEEEIAANVTSWPEWFAILNQQGVNKNTPQRPDKPQKKFGRYQNLKKQGGTVPSEFSAFNERFRETAQNLTQQTLEYISKAILYSLQRFETHADFRAGVENFQQMIYVDRIGDIEEALPLLDVWNPSKLAEDEVIPTVLDRIQDEVKDIENLSYPYDGAKPCFWNMALIIRVQVQLIKTYRDRLSRLVAAAETHFQNFFCNEVLRAEVLPLVRTVLNKPDFLGEVALGERGATWEGIGQIIRAAVDKYKEMESGHVSSPTAAAKPAADEGEEAEAQPEVKKPAAGNQSKDVKKPATAAAAPTGNQAKDVKKPATPAAAPTGNQAKDVKKPATPAAAPTAAAKPAGPTAQMTPAKAGAPAVAAKPVAAKPPVAEAPAIEEEPVDDLPGAKKGKPAAGGKKDSDEFDEW